jgi:hypothetical protein
MSFGPWNDGDAGLVCAIWCLIRHLRAERIVETGVAHGFTSRFILEALESNRAGHLWSVDLPHWMMMICGDRSVLLSPQTYPIGGPTSKVRAEGGSLSCCLSWGKLISSCMTAYTPSATCGSSLIKYGRVYDLVGQ